MQLANAFLIRLGPFFLRSGLLERGLSSFHGRFGAMQTRLSFGLQAVVERIRIARLNRDQRRFTRGHRVARLEHDAIDPPCERHRDDVLLLDPRLPVFADGDEERALCDLAEVDVDRSGHEAVNDAAKERDRPENSNEPADGNPHGDSGAVFRTENTSAKDSDSNGKPAECRREEDFTVIRPGS